METNRKAVIVGVFIFIGILFFMVAVFTLGNLKKTFVKNITIKTVFDDVNGLQKGNNVWFSGVKIGTVKKISFYGKAQVEVEMNIEEKSQQYIRKDAKAKIGSDGLIGNKIIVIYGGSAQAAAIEPGDHLFIEKTMSTDDIMNTLQKNNQNLLSITNDFKNLAASLNQGQGTVGKLLKDETLYNNLESTMMSLRKASTNTQQLTASLSEYSSKLQKKGTLANELANDTTVFKSIQSTVFQLNEVAASAKQLTASLQDSESSPLGLMIHDQESTNSLKGTIKNLESSSHKLDEDLEALQHNFLLKGFFKKKAKKEQQDQKDKAKAISDAAVQMPH